MPSRDARSAAPVLAVLLAVQLMVVLDGTVVTVALPSVRDDLGVGDVALAWVVNAFVVAFAVTLLPAGRLGDVRGTRPVFLTGLAVFVGSSVWCALAWSPAALVAARAAQGVGAGLASAVVLGMVAALYDDAAARARAFGLLAFVGAAGASIGTVAGGVLTEAAGWRSVFWVNVPVGLAALAGAVVLLGRGPRPSVGGGVLSGLRALGAVLAVRSFTVLAVVLVTMTVAGFSFQFLSALYLRDVLGLGATRTGLAFLAVTAAIALCSLWVSPALGARWGRGRVLVAGLVLFVAGLGGLARFPADGTYLVDVAPWFGLAGAGFGLAVPQVTDLAMGRSDPAHAGLASGVVATAQQLGGTIGLAVVPAVAAVRTASLDAGADPSAYAVADGLRLGLLVAVGVLVLGTALAVGSARRPVTTTADAPVGPPTTPPRLEPC